MWCQSQTGRLVNLALARCVGVTESEGVYLVRATFDIGDGKADAEVLGRCPSRDAAQQLVASLMTTLRCGGGHYTVAPVQLDAEPGDAVAAGVGAAPWTPWSEGRE